MSETLHKVVASEQPLTKKQMVEFLRRGRQLQIVVDGVLFDTAPELDACMRRMCEAAADSPAEEMTTNQAAEFLDVSRPFVIKLIKRGELPCRMVGKHRRIPAAALVAYKEKMFQQARNAANEMAEMSQAAGLYDTKGSSSR
jgi:excisionase family DNA binding protein